MNVRCLILRHKWRTREIHGKPYEVCDRCGHFRNDVHWHDLNANIRTPGFGSDEVMPGPPPV